MAMQQSSDIHVPLDIQYLILESADWDDHAILAQVCSTWRNFLQTSHTALDKRYQSIYEIFPVIPLGSQFTTPKIHRALSGRYMVLGSGFEFDFCHWVPFGASQYKSHGTIHQEAKCIGFFSKDPAMRLPSGPGDHINIATRRADVWFQRSFDQEYPMSLDTGGGVPTVGLLLYGALSIAENGYTGADHAVTLLKCWTQGFYDPVVFGIAWRVQYLSGGGPPYLDLSFDIHQVGTGRKEEATASFLRGVSPFFTPLVVVFLRQALAFRTKAALVFSLQRLVPTFSRTAWITGICGFLTLLFFLRTEWYPAPAF
ncbi:hypothetical protein TWF569_006307 [Orbilia oligospora]|nr:hypothetical protein TWF569_006307 [Orbilia oligospora]